MKKELKLLLSALAAGVCIGIGGIIYVSLFSVSKIVGAFLFALGLFTIICYQFSLFTGKVGYIFENKISYLLDLLIIWIGNFLGTLFVALLYRHTRMFSNEANQILQNIVMAKQNDQPLSIFILSLFCGMLMYIAVNTQRKENIHPIFKLLAIFICVAGFILCGFEHVIANMFYISVSGLWSFKIVLYLLLMTLGNGIGSLIIWGFEKGIIMKKQSN